MIETNAILAINSLDRYTTSNTDFFSSFGSPATTNYSLIASYRNATPYSNDFQINTPGVLTYGYISKIVVSQIQIQYNVPTVIDGLNNSLVIGIDVGQPIPAGVYVFDIPSGFYTPFELAAVIEGVINNVILFGPFNFSVVYNPELYQFEFSTQANVLEFYFPDDQDLIRLIANNDAELDLFLKTYKLFGIGFPNRVPDTIQNSSLSPNLLYTPYIDIYSNALTAYQKLSDGNSTVSRPKGLLARVYLSGVGQPQITTLGDALGSRSFVVTIDLNTPKVIRWTKDVAINSIDFQMRDCYGELLPGRDQGSNTEFQMTLLCVEGEQEY